MRRVIFVSLVILIASISVYSQCYAQEKESTKVSKKLKPPVLNFYNWEDYIAPSVLEGFEKEFGVKVNLQTFEDEEEMFSSVQSNPAKYDLIIATDGLVNEMKKARLLAPIDLENISNFKHIEPRFISLETDPHKKYSVPYLWGTTGIAYNADFIKEEVNSWAILWDAKYKGNISMLNSPYEVIGAALKYLGYSLNTTNPSQLQEAREKLLEQKPLIRGYDDPITVRDNLVSNKLWIAQAYSGDAMYAILKNKSINYIIPKEGASLWVDSLCIPRDTPHKYTAEVFINYLLSPKVSLDTLIVIWLLVPIC